MISQTRGILKEESCNYSVGSISVIPFFQIVHLYCIVISIFALESLIQFHNNIYYVVVLTPSFLKLGI